MRLGDCHNVEDFRRLAKRRLPRPVFDYIDGGADDEVTLRRNVAAFDDCDLVPNVLAGVAEIDMSVTVLGRKIAMPLMLSPTAMQRLFHWEGERAVARAVAPFDTYFGISTIGTVSIEEIGRSVAGAEAVPALRPSRPGAEPRAGAALQGRRVRRDRAHRRHDRRRQSRARPL